MKHQVFTVLQVSSRRDPTRTTTLRNRFINEMNSRFRFIRKEVIQSVYNNDCFNLRASELFAHQKIIFNAPISKAQFDFPQNKDKVKAFMSWLGQQQNDKLLTVSKIPSRKVANEESWMDYYLESSYKRGIINAQSGMKKANIEYVSRPINASFTRPLHADRVGLLYTRAFNGLKGITDEMDKQISSTLAQGLVDGLSPFTLAKQITDRIDKIGITRARILARTEVIRTHAEATLNEFEEANLEGVQVLAEWLTGGFDVCPICADLEETAMTIKEAHGMLPRHPNCKCTWVPYTEDMREKISRKKETKVKYGQVSILDKEFKSDISIGKDSFGNPLAVFAKNENRTPEQISKLEEIKNKIKSSSDKKVNAKYVKRVVEQIENGWAGCVAFDKDGNLVGGVSFEKISDSLRIELLGSTSPGIGSNLIRESISMSSNMGKDGQITLTPIQDINTITFYAKCGFDSKRNSDYGEFFMDKESSSMFSKQFDSIYGKVEVPTVHQHEKLSAKELLIKDALKDDFLGNVSVLAERKN